VNCAVFRVKDDWKGQLRSALLPVKTAHFTYFFPSGMTSHNKIAPFV